MSIKVRLVDCELPAIIDVSVLLLGFYTNPIITGFRNAFRLICLDLNIEFCTCFFLTQVNLGRIMIRVRSIRSVLAAHERITVNNIRCCNRFLIIRYRCCRMIKTYAYIVIIRIVYKRNIFRGSVLSKIIEFINRKIIFLPLADLSF